MSDGHVSPDSTTVTLVVPCYNESQRLDVAAFTTYAAANPEVGFVFVDDGSTDGTHEIIETMLDRNPAQFRLKRLAANTGKAGAVRAGVLAALELPTSIVGYWDADLATPLAELEPMRRILEERPAVHVVTGARVNLLGRAVRRNLVRQWIGRIFATVASAALGLPMYDTQCGAKLFRVQAWTGDLFADPFLTSWVFDVELLARLAEPRIAAVAGDPRSVICEHPLDAWSETRGSKLTPRDAFVAVIDLARIYLRHRGRRLNRR